MSDPADYTVLCTPGTRSAALGGVLRLESTEAYERIFQPIRSEMTATTSPYTLDLSGVVFMNSSGVRAVAVLVLAARAANVPLRIRIDAQSFWQKKTLATLRNLDPRLGVESEKPAQEPPGGAAGGS